MGKKANGNMVAATIMVIGIFSALAYIAFGAQIENAVESFIDAFPKMVSTTAAIISIALCVYCLVRTIVALACNRFLPQVPMPKNKVAKFVLLGIMGVLIGFFSPIWVATLWIITCLLGLVTYSFV